LLRDSDGDGRAELRANFLSNLNSPFGVTLVGDTLYVADTDAVLRFFLQEWTNSRSPTKAASLWTFQRHDNHHWTKNVIARPDGSKLYVTVGSNSNVGENGLAAEQDRAAIWEVNLANGQHRIFATGMRNPNWHGWGSDGALWTVVNERGRFGAATWCLTI